MADTGLSIRLFHFVNSFATQRGRIITRTFGVWQRIPNHPGFGWTIEPGIVS